MIERKDDYLQRREHLKSMSDSELKKYFFELADKLVDPLLDLGFKNTTKSIERSILLRMGFSSIQAKEIVEIISEIDLMSKGAGHCIYAISKKYDLGIEEAGSELINGKHVEFLMEYFGKNE
ncbi:ornithine aminomutase [Candidatus Izimaplasma bacterium ZiA1]|uniref:ornithine aminomutase subunit alpha n=1 Tax=Candidatus Izimoplasma sp. ZiA1 TaxID=2024899 RepID=UPI000BAA4C87|nr:ornithine aminomutase [Candidatus Izimaplasma bacterium ZiA1]